MLQRAASNAYSWWWASHIRTKQSKWMEQNLQDMEEKVQAVLRLLEEDGDSFAKRAEMYYKRRPELINFVEESFRAYRALADRYDHISTELQNANTTIASVCPEQVQFDMDDNDDSPRSRTANKLSETAVSAPNIPKVPLPTRDLKTLLTRATKKLQTNKAGKTSTITKPLPKSGLNKTQAVVEIDKLQKSILAMQTEKEFVKSSYENGMAKYWEIDKQITETQDKICSLQDEFSVSTVIEDNDARNLMASTALRSCEETLACLEEKHERSTNAAQIERPKIENAREKLDSLRNGLDLTHIQQELSKNNDEYANAQRRIDTLDQSERTEAESSSDENEQQLNLGFDESFTLIEMTEKIDELVSKVLNLETAVSSQDALIKRLRTEADDLQAIIQILEQEKVNGTGGTSNLSDKLMEVEKKLDQVQQISQNIDDQNTNLKGHFIDAHCNLNHLSQILPSVILDEVDMVHASEVMDASTVAPEAKLRIQEEEKDSNLENLSQQNDKLQVAFDEKMKFQLQDKNSNRENGLRGNDMPTVEPETIKNYQEQEDGKRNDSSSLVPETKMKSPGLEIVQNQQHGFHLNSIDTAEKAINVESPAQVNNSKSQYTNASIKNQEGAEMSGQKVTKAPDVQSQTTLDPEPRNADEQINAFKEVDGPVDVHAKENGKEEDEPNWKELFKSGLEDREKKLLLEYTTTLRNFKDLKKKLTDVEKENKDIVFQISVQRSFIAKKDEEIQSLRQKLSCLMAGSAENKEEVKNTEIEYGDEDCDDLKQILMGEPKTVSAIEEKFRMDIDELLEENLDFWLRFSSSFHQIQKFQTEVEDLQDETSKLEDKLNKKEEGSTSASRARSLKSDARPIYKHLSEIQTEITIWIEQSALLKTELQTRFSSLCNIQDEISGAISGSLLEGSSSKHEAKFTSYQAAKFQGEILNMKQENNKVADELQAAADHASKLQQEIEKTLAQLNDDFKLSETNHHHQNSQPGQPQLGHTDSKSRVPLQSFIFGTKQKKPRYSIFSSMHPALNRRNRHLRAKT